MSLFFFFNMRVANVELSLRVIAQAYLPPSLPVYFSPLHHQLLLLLPHPISLLATLKVAAPAVNPHHPPFSPTANHDPFATPSNASPLFSPTFRSVSPPLFSRHLCLSPSSCRSVPRVTPHELFTLYGKFSSVYCSNID